MVQTATVAAALPWRTIADTSRIFARDDEKDPFAEECFLHAGRSDISGRFSYVGNNSLETPIAEEPLTLYVRTEINEPAGFPTSRMFFVFSPDQSLTFDEPEELNFHGCAIYFRSATNADNILPRPDELNSPPDLRCGDVMGNDCVFDVNELARNELERIIRERENGNSSYPADNYTCDLVIDAIEENEVPASCDFPLWTHDELSNRSAFWSFRKPRCPLSH